MSTEDRMTLERAHDHYRAGRLAESEALLTQLRDSPDVGPQARYLLGLVHLGREDRDAAWRELSAAADADPASPHPLYYLATIAERDGDRVAAISLYGGVLVRAPDHQNALRAVARLASPTETPGRPTPPAAPPVSSEPQGARPPRPPRREGSTVGIVRDLEKGLAPWRGRMNAMQVWTFRVEGSPEPTSTFVELRGLTIEGVLREGHWVEVPGPHDGELARPKEVANLTTGGTITARTPLHMRLGLIPGGN